MITGTGALLTGSFNIHADVAIRDATGTLKSDSGQLRHQAEARFITTMAPTIGRSKQLRTLVDSYRRASEDRENELVHLYEIKDALKAHFGSLRRAEQGFADAAKHLDTLGRLSNGAFLEGRHRGAHPGQLRHATAEERADARTAAVELILGFATTLP
jgi:hypothetical protein